MRKIRVLVVDDSIIYRDLFTRGLSSDPAIEVVASAANVYDARDKIIQYRPDVMTLDVEMPRMDGIEFLRQLMPQYPMPVIMVSSKNQTVFDALAAGAVDFVNKPVSGNINDIERFVTNELAAKVKIAVSARLSVRRQVQPEQNRLTYYAKDYKDKVIAVGASTGGTEAIASVIKNFGTDIPGVVIVQHMPPGFTKMYAERLDRECAVSVSEAKTGDAVLPGKVLIAPGDAHMQLIRTGTGYTVECKTGEKVSGHCPSVDVLFNSVARNAGKDAIGVLLTGMGADGARGLLAMKNAGAQTIGQDESTCVVYGMPKVAFDIGAVKYQLKLDDIAAKVYYILNSGTKK